MTNKLFIFGLAFIFCLAFVSSEIQSLDTLQKDKCLNLPQICANCSYNNLTAVFYPNSTNALSDQIQMQKVGTSYNYTFCKSNVSGHYIVTGFGDIDGVPTTWTYDFEINPIGIQSTDVRSNTMSRAIWIVFIIALAFFACFIILQNPSVRYTFLVVSMIFTVITINLVFVTLTNEVSDPNITKLFDLISASSFYFYWFGAGMIFIIWVLTLFNTIYERFSKQKYDKFNISTDARKYG